MNVTDEMVEALDAALAELREVGGEGPNDTAYMRMMDGLSRLRAALAAESKVKAEPVAFLVDDFHVGRLLVKANGKFPEPDHFLYPANREADARDVARVMRGTYTPLYAHPPADAHREALEVIESFIAETVDYATRNNLGDPEKQHNVRWGRKVLSAHPEKD